MMYTTIDHKIQVKTQGCEVSTSDAHTFETDDFDPRNTEHIVAWFYQVLNERKTSYQEFDDGHITVSPQMSRLRLVQDNSHGLVQALTNIPDIKYDVYIETTLDNNKAKNPKKWSVKINCYDIEHAFDKDLHHHIEWTRLPEEALDWTGLQAGVARRNIFGILRK